MISRSTHIFYLLVCIAVLFLMACSSDELSNEVKDYMEDTLVHIEPTNPPATLTNYLGESDVLFLGELHYVQEHQEFIVSILPSLSEKGFTVLYDELFHAFSWMAEDYVTGKINDIPEYIRYFQHTLLEGLRTFNIGKTESQQIRLRYFDVNHWEDNFQLSLQEVEKIVGSHALFDPILELDGQSEEYVNALRSLGEKLLNDKSQLLHEWGDVWYDRISDLVHVEIKSFDHRENRDSETRENIMLDNIERYEDGVNKFLVNAGFVHAQKANYLVNNNHDRLGRLLDNQYDQVSAIVFSAIRGTRRANFYEEKLYPFDLSEDSDDDDLIREFVRLSSDQVSFTRIDVEIFTEQNIKMSYATGSRATAPIGLQFDAIIVYPQISILTSMTEFDWRR